MHIASCEICGDGKVEFLRFTSYPDHPNWYRCTNCRSECLRPQPDDLRLSEIYGPEYYEPWTWERPEIVQAAKSHTLIQALSLAAPHPGQRLLDVGCAQGEFAAVASQRGLKVFGVDLNPQAVLTARERVPEGTFWCGEIDAAAAAANFDVITMFDFIEHVRDPIETLRQAASLLDPNGSLLVSTPRAGSVTHRMMGRIWPQYREEHLHLLSLAGLTLALGQASMTVVRFQPTTKYLTGSYLLGQLASYSTPTIEALTKRFRAVNSLTPMHWQVPMRFGEVLVLARRDN